MVEYHASLRFFQWFQGAILRLMQSNFLSIPKLLQRTALRQLLQNAFDGVRP